MPIKIDLLIIFIFVSILCQKLFVIPQMNSITNHIRKISTNGICGYGVGRNRLGFRKYYLIITDKDGNIINAEKMEGWSIFARFKPDKKIKEKNIFEICTEKDFKRLNSLEVAKIQAAKNVISKISGNLSF
ncbi:hypothetical protein DXT63_17015 [Thermoanaerobacteraceae bacterium SP2]|nr:hypothetical protein DXT63_17015 [Thermoanaerobacteraceae bacterium SP2]